MPIANWYSTNSDLTVPAEVICQQQHGGGYMPIANLYLVFSRFWHPSPGLDECGVHSASAVVKGGEVHSVSQQLDQLGFASNLVITSSWIGQDCSNWPFSHWVGCSKHHTFQWTDHPSWKNCVKHQDISQHLQICASWWYRWCDEMCSGFGRYGGWCAQNSYT